VVVVVPMAGRGSRFSGPESGGLPKPLVSIRGRPMVAWALESLRDVPRSRMVFVALKEHEERFDVSETLRRWAGEDAAVCLVPDVTEGQLCTVLEAAEHIDTDEDVLIASSDTLVVSRLRDDIARRPPQCAGIISVAELPGDHWSFARLGEDGRVVEVAEKRRISPLCSTGLYWFASGRDLLREGRAMVQRGERTRGEFFVIPLYQNLIEQGRRVDVSRASQVWDMGTPDAAKRFEERSRLRDAPE
jgi:NDP-sugar pyrophosphorylase family protein